MTNAFTIIGAIVIVFVALLFVSWFVGFVIDRHDWVPLAWLWSVVISTAIISACILCHILEMS